MQNICLELKRSYVWLHLLQAKKYVWEKPFQKSVDENFSKAKFYMNKAPVIEIGDFINKRQTLYLSMSM